MKAKEASEKLRRIHNELRELANEIEKELSFSLSREEILTFGYNLAQVKEFIDFGTSKDFKPKEKDVS